MLGATGTLPWKQKRDDVEVTLPDTLPGKYAYALKISGGVE
jgi:hypothetical protein